MPRLPFRFSLALLLTGLAAAVAWPVSARATMVGFEWDPVDQIVSGGSGSTTVRLLAVQTDGADAAAITLGLEVGGAITGFDLLGYGSAVSAADSVCCDLGGTPGIIAVAPASPGSFGVDVDFEVATFTLFYDFGAETMGTFSLVDLSSIAGSPALDAAAGVIPSDISAVHTVIPEPATAMLTATGLLMLSAWRRS